MSSRRQSRRQSRQQWRRREQGAMAVLVALVTCFVLIPVGALTVDIGMQRVARQDMQSLADTVALDMARSLAAGTAPTDALATASAGTVSGTLGSTPVLRVYAGYIAPSPVFVSDQSLGCGSSATYNAYFQDPAALGRTPNAVLVTASSSVRFALVGGSGGVCRASLATTSSTACFKLGSYAARLDSSNSALLTNLLDGALSANVSAASYQGLATADVGLGALATQLGVGTVDQLATTTVSVKSLYVAAAAVVGNSGNTAAATVLSSIAASTTSTGSVTLGNLLNATLGTGAAATGTINALDLVSGSAFLANGTSLLSVPSLGTSIGLTGTNLTATAKVIQAAQEACGKVGTTAGTSQVDVSLSGSPASVTVPASLTGLSLAPVGSATTTLNLNVANATGTLSAIVCGAGTAASPQGMDVAVTSSLATASLSQTLQLGGSITAQSGLLGGLLGGLLNNVLSVSISGTIKLTATSSQPATSGTASVRYPVSPPSWATPVTSGGSSSLALSTTNVVVSYPNGPLTLTASGLLGPIALTASQSTTVSTNLVTNLTTGVLAPLVSSVNSSVLGPLFALLGVEVGGADVFGVPTPSCNTPGLAG